MTCKIVCTVDGCGARSVARRLCRRHYQAAWRAGELGQHQPQPPRRKLNGHVCPPDHKHAEATTCYIQHQCRRDECIDDHVARGRSRRRAKAYGRFDTGLVDADPVREHILMLAEHGIGYKRVAQIAGVSLTGVRTLVWGRQDPGPRFGEIPKRVGREKATKILAVQPTIANMADGAKVASVGTHRRIQALVARGWSMTKLASRLDMGISNFITMLHRPQVLAGTHRAMAEVYEELWNQDPPAGEWHSKAARTRSINYARRHGWLPPLAWDDIDTDPTPEPLTQGRVTADELLDDVEFLLEAGESAEQVAVTVGRTMGAIAKLASHHGRDEIARTFNAADSSRRRAAS